MYQMPQPGGGYPQQGYPQQGYPPPGGFQMPQPGGGYPPPPGYPPQGGYNNYTNQQDDESEYEYITDEDGDYIEDENGNIFTTEEAQNRGLVEPATGERGIGKKILIGGAVLGGIHMLRKHLKKKKKVKKQKNNQSQYSNQPNPNIYGQTVYAQNPPQNIYGAPQQMNYNKNIL
ncbi:hypothetical protein PIROE2DRAFT_12089 [Piromyces sp. E2]|nr:hypothetical protein PIROE2DRAFT_12089 [Piromyces sp. E2]|eukprot:OUM61834.1 hypothetical protein PIROE2DRAFT_12089 [Piromyces sp. E2]